MKSILALSLIVAMAGSASAFQIMCELDGQHGGDADRVAPDEEARLLRDAVADAYPVLPPYLQEVARHVPFMVLHKWTAVTKKFMGYSAEDDPSYAYPDTHYYGERYSARDAQGNATEKTGTIKVNFTEKFIRTLELGRKLGAGNSRAAEGIRAFSRGVIAHELNHAFQYHTGPVRDLERFPEAIKNGLADPQVLSDTEKKVQYERDTYGVERGIEAGHQDDFLALADAVEAYARANPDLFKTGGPYHTLALDVPNPLVGRYLRENVRTIGMGSQFNDSEKIIYEGQYAPPSIVLRLKRINDVMEKEQKAATALLDGGVASIKAPDVTELENQWAFYMTATPLAQSGKETYGYLKDVEKQYDAQLARYRSLGQ